MTATNMVIIKTPIAWNHKIHPQEFSIQGRGMVSKVNRGMQQTINPSIIPINPPQITSQPNVSTYGRMSHNIPDPAYTFGV